jgi:hypothetical protein
MIYKQIQFLHERISMGDQHLDRYETNAVKLTVTARRTNADLYNVGKMNSLIHLLIERKKKEVIRILSCSVLPR